MAQLKDTIVTGDLSVTGTIYGDVPLDDLTGYTGTSGFLKKENDSWSLSAVTIPDATSVKGDAETTYRTGQVNLTPANLGISATTSSVTVGSTTFNKYTHPTTEGNKHIPSGGSSGQFLGWSSAGTAAWVDNPNIDTKVTQAAAITTAGNYPILLAYDTNTTAVTNTVNKTSNLLYNPNTKELTTNGTITLGNGTTAILNAKTPSRSSSFLIVGGGKNTAGNGDGTVIRLGAGGLTIVGGGEYASARYNVADLSDRTEQLYLGADGAVFIETNANTIADRKTFGFTTSGNLSVPNIIAGEQLRYGLELYARPFVAAATSDTNKGGEIYYDAGANDGYTKSQWYFRQYSWNATKSVTPLTYYDNFYLPNTTSGLTANGSYAILTSKNAVTVAQGGTGATTAAAARTNLLAATGNGRVFYGTCATAAGTAEKAVTCASYDALTTGDIIIVKFSTTNTAAVADLKLNVNSKGAKAIKKLYNYALSNLNNVGELRSNVINMFVYDGTNWILSNADYNTNTNTLLRTWSSATDINVPLIGQSSANSITAAWSTYTADYKDWYGAIPNDDTKRTKINLSTGRLTVGSSSMGTDTAIVRNISYGTTEPTGGNAGQVYIQYANGGKPEIFPIGAIYMSVSAVNPSEFFAGTWIQVAQGRAIFGAGTCSGINYTSGSTVDAGLPNVSGSVGQFYTDYNVGNNAYSSLVSAPFYYNESDTVGVTQDVAPGDRDGLRTTYMDLSRSNSIYGSSTTVQPNAFVCYIWQRTA